MSHVIEIQKSRQLHIEGLFASPAELWENVLAALRRLPGKQTLAEWLRDARPVSLAGGELAVEVPPQLAPEFTARRCRGAIEGILRDLLGEEIRVRFLPAPQPPPTDPGAPRPAPAAPPLPAPERSRSGRPLNTRYRFESFVVGESNRFAWAAAMAVASSPGSVYNPLVLCGATGVGKTHLLQAIGHEIHRLHPRLRVCCVPGDLFTYEFVTSLRERRTDTFRRRYRGVDVWLFDDFQFVAGKTSTEEEFFLTFIALQEAGRQIVLCCDRYPRHVEPLDGRLRSRLESGVIAEIGCPDVEARVAILRRKAEAERASISPDVLLYIAHLVPSNVRTLEGALIKLLAYSSLTGRPPTEDLARGVLEAYARQPAPETLTVEAIQQAACEVFRVDRKALNGRRRDRAVVVPRQVAMYLARRLTASSLVDIGRRFGGRDHSTVIAACTRVEAALKSDAELRSRLEEITHRLGIEGA
ncbi:MAG: chromosomal replication initiator protein DnaA [Armatimonadetes bacterium]|nr:chromosomal replication initiator protein DnaA [Armatimonadota bacterium]